MALNSKLFVTKVIFNRDAVDDLDKYPFNVKVIKHFNEIEFTSQVTFLIGENGIGKSTFLEALAVKLGLNAEGGSQNFRFKTLDTHSNLSNYFHVTCLNKPTTKFFLRAESYYNVASEIVVQEEQSPGMFDIYGGNPHACSHGESFIKLVQNRFYPNGLYLLDEPEAALSPERQMSLLCLIDDLVKKGSQFIISTHSPILIAYRDGKIMDLDQNFKEVNYYDTKIYSLYKLYLENPLEMQRKLFD